LIEELMMYEVAIEIRFDAAHRLLNYAGKCHNLHGHSYVAIIGVAKEKLVECGFVVDFGYLKKYVKGWIDEHWDHASILNSGDPLVRALQSMKAVALGEAPQDGLRIFVMNGDPTAERMAKRLFDAVTEARPSKTFKVRGISAGGYPTEIAEESIDDPIIVKYVTIKETPTSWATYTKD